MRFVPDGILALALAALPLAGCEAIALTGFGVGAATGVSHTMSGMVYRTFTAPLPRVRSATLTALQHMQIKVQSIGKVEEGEEIKAKSADRDIEVTLEAVSPNTTRMRVIAKKGVFPYDSATGTEIIMQTERVMGNP
jgi:hypothetical protein